MINFKSVAVVSGLILGSISFTSCDDASEKKETEKVVIEEVVVVEEAVVADSIAVVVDTTVVVEVKEVTEAAK